MVYFLVVIRLYLFAGRISYFYAVCIIIDCWFCVRFFFNFYFCCVCVIVIVCVGVAGDYAKFGLLSYIRRGVNNRIFTNFLNIIQITQLLYNTFPAQDFISRHLSWISDNWSWIKCVGLAPFLTFTALTCWVPSDTYIQYNVSTSPNHYKYWCDFGCFLQIM